MFSQSFELTSPQPQEPHRSAGKQKGALLGGFLCLSKTLFIYFAEEKDQPSSILNQQLIEAGTHPRLNQAIKIVSRPLRHIILPGSVSPQSLLFFFFFLPCSFLQKLPLK